MENVCRLCANVKTPKQLTCSIEDPSLNIKQKLISCCNWNLYEGYDATALPHRICSVCLKSLEKCWSFAESVAQAQQYLLTQIDLKPNLMHVETADILHNTNTNQEQKDFIEDIKISLSPQELVHCEDDFAEPLPGEFIAINEEVFPISAEVKQEEELHKRKKEKINFLKLVSKDDKNADGTVNKEIIVKLNLHDWSVVKWSCSICREIFECHRQLKSHFEEKHCENKLRILCTFCDLSYGERRSLLRHITLKHLPYLKHCCKKCCTFFWDLNVLKKHLCASNSLQQSQDPNLCEICGKSFMDKMKLQNHKRLHLPIEERRIFECYVCKKNFIRKRSLHYHMPIHWGQKIQHQCDICLLKFSRPDALRRHLLIHLNKLPYSCQYCTKGFRNKFNLKVHERIHTGEKPYACKYCDYRSSDGPNLGKHIKQRHKNQVEVKNTIFSSI